MEFERLHKGVLEGYTREFEKVTQGSLRRLHKGV